MDYRDDIDGLRAISVICVVLFHAAFPLFSQGFLGVDIFFVISGFLISSQIFDALERGTFSLAGFYERRARRILPAVFVVYVGTFAAAWCLMPPGALISFARSLISAVLFVSNWFFLFDASYFGFAAESKALLHTWSLSVEEQFYVLFPVMVMFLTGWKRTAIVLLAFIASLACARYFSNAGQLDALFFSSPSRFFEPLSGVLAAIAYRRFEFGAWTSAGLRAIGLAIIGYAVFRDPTGNHHREMIVPCIGAAAVLLARPVGSDPLFRILASLPFKTIGRLSYSLYLWHWPVFVFARSVYGTLTVAQTIVCIALSCALSFVSLHMVENPIRFRRVRLSRGQIFASSGAAMGCLVLLGSVMATRDPSSIPLPPDAQRFEAASKFDLYLYRCFDPEGGPDAVLLAMAREDRLCRIGSSHGVPQFIVWGDSHAFASLPAFANLATERDITGLVAVYPGCPSLINTINVELVPARKCPDYFNAVLDLVRMRDIKTVFMVDRWSLYLLGEIGPVRTGIMQFADDQHREPNLEAVFRKSIEDTITALGNRRIVFVKEPPTQTLNVTATLITNAMLGRPASFLDERWTKLSAHRKRNSVIDQVFKDVAAKHPNLVIIDAADGVCQGDECPVLRDGLPVYLDDDHLSHRGSPIVLGPLLSATFDDMKECAGADVFSRCRESAALPR